MQLQFLIDGEIHTAQTDDNGYVEITFDKNTTSQIEVIPSDDCGGVTFLDDIQLEKDDTATSYEEPALIQGEATGLIEDIRALQYSINDPATGLRSQLSIMSQGFETEVTDLIGGYSRQGQTINGLFADMYNPDGRVSTAIQTVDGFKQTVQDLESGTGTVFEQLSDGFRQRIDSYLGGSELFNETVDTVDAHSQIIGNTSEEFENNVSRILQTSDIIQSTVESSINAELETEYKTVVSYVPYDDPPNQYNRWVQTGTREIIFTLSKALEPGKSYRFTIDYTTYNGAKNATTTLDYGGNTVNSTLYTSQTQAMYFVFVPANSLLPLSFSIKFLNALSDSVLGWGNITHVKVDVSETTQVPINGTNTGAIRTEINQLYNMINMQVLGAEGALSRLSIGEQGITLQSQLIHLSGKSLIDDAVIKSAMIESMTADKLTAGEINAAQIRVINLDARSIAGYEATFIQAMFNGLHSRVRINGAGMDVLTNDGTVSSHFDENGIEIFKDGVLVGEFESRNSISTTGALANKKSISMTPERSAYASISYFRLGESSSTRVISVNGNNGDIYVNPYSIIRGSERDNYGIRLTAGTVGGIGGVRIYNHDDTGGLQITNGNVYWRTMDGTWANLNDAAAGAYMP